MLNDNRRTRQGSKLGNKFQSHSPSGDDVRLKSSRNLATAPVVLVARATGLVAVSSPASAPWCSAKAEPSMVSRLRITCIFTKLARHQGSRSGNVTTASSFLREVSSTANSEGWGVGLDTKKKKSLWFSRSPPPLPLGLAFLHSRPDLSRSSVHSRSTPTKKQRAVNRLGNRSRRH